METKKLIGTIIILLVMAGCSGKKDRDGASAARGTIAISGAWALYPLAVIWADEYRKQNPEVLIDISAGGAGRGMADALAGSVDLGMVSHDVTGAERDRGAWSVIVARDAVIPVINEKNPLKDALLKRGLSRNDFAGIWVTDCVGDWNRFVKTDTLHRIHIYTRSDACGAAETWAKYAGGSQEDLKGIGVYGDPGLLDAVRGDMLGIGYNNINYAYDARTGRPVSGILPLPIDLNGNGMIDPAENFYADRDSLTRAIAENRFPCPPARSLSLVSRGAPRKPEVVRFLAWILGEGQRHAPDAGYIALSGAELTKQIVLLSDKR